MKLLAWDTSTTTGSIAALEFTSDASGGPKLVAEWSFQGTALHSERLLWCVDQVVESSGWKISEVDVFGVGIGPGSFTGLRIGVTTARTLAQSLGRKVVPICSLAAIARPHAERFVGRGVEVVVAVDACKGEVFSLRGKPRDLLSIGHPYGLWNENVSLSVSPPEDLARAIDGEFVLIGNAGERYPDVFEEISDRRVPLGASFGEEVQGRYAALLAYEGFLAGNAEDPLSVEPIYLRASSAELKMKAGLIKRAPVEAESLGDQAPT